VRRLTTFEKHSSEWPLLFLVAALFAIQKEIYLLPEIGGKGDHCFAALRARQLTFLWNPITHLGESQYSALLLPGFGTLRTELDWESCTIEFVIIVLVRFLYFARLERRND